MLAPRGLTHGGAEGSMFVDAAGCAACDYCIIYISPGIAATRERRTALSPGRIRFSDEDTRDCVNHQSENP
jgi:hypothetical protein